MLAMLSNGVKSLLDTACRLTLIDGHPTENMNRNRAPSTAGDRQAGARGQGGEFGLEHPGPRAVGAAAIGADQ